MKEKKPKPLTKEQLLKENDDLKDTLLSKQAAISNWETWDSRRRERFSIVLRSPMSWDDRLGLSNLSTRPETLSWEEIFCQVGKLLMCNRSHDWERQVDQRLDSVRERLDKVDPPINVGGLR